MKAMFPRGLKVLLKDLFFSLNAKSKNKKTGRIAVSIVSARTCPLSCAFLRVCYASSGPLRMHWQAVTDGFRSMKTQVTPQTLAEHCKALRALPADTLFRHGSAGDLPANGKRLFLSACRAIFKATAHLDTFLYTHYADTDQNVAAVAALNAEFPRVTINFSANSIADAERLQSHPLRGGSPIAVVCNITDKRHMLRSGQVIVRCPAEYSKVQCGNPAKGFRACGGGKPLCAVKDRTYWIGFNTHGAEAGKVTAAMEADSARRLPAAQRTAAEATADRIRQAQINAVAI